MNVRVDPLVRASGNRINDHYIIRVNTRAYLQCLQTVVALTYEDGRKYLVRGSVGSYRKSDVAILTFFGEDKLSDLNKAIKAGKIKLVRNITAY